LLADLVPHLLNLGDPSNAVWAGAEKLFHSKIAEAAGAGAGAGAAAEKKSA
jgi:hypothetical protein